jgi:hypothetical protein
MTTLATRGTASLAALPEHLKALVGVRDGKENVGMEDLLIPRLCVAQQLSPQIDKTKEQFIKGLEQGQLFNSLTGHIYGDEATVIPLFFFKNFIHFKPIRDGGGVLAQYATKDDVPKELIEWGSGDKAGTPPQVTEFKNRMCMIDSGDGNWQPIVVSFKSTGMKFAKKWNSLINMVPIPAYGRLYTLKAVAQAKGNNSWFAISPVPAEFSPQPVCEAAKAMFDGLQQKGYKVDDTGLDHDEAGDPSFDGADM